MRPTPSTGRRTFLKTATVAGAGALLAGCTSTGTADSGDGSSGSDNNGTSADSDSAGGASSSGGASAFDGWLDGTNYDGSVTDKTGASEATVKVGAETSSGPYAFAPPAVTVKTGTTVIWEWTGDGGSHNVVAQDGSFESELSAEKGHTFEHTFDSSGTYKYFCAPHKSMGMKGVVLVK
ncbi:MAG TPA: halocyanin domain-containing protein [Halococcus sp.]|nr:halocyanin domain-containing protein [Halococcus sp.]